MTYFDLYAPCKRCKSVVLVKFPTDPPKRVIRECSYCGHKEAVKIL